MNLIEKIAEVQKEIGKMSKNQKGYNYQYFDINQILEQLKPLLEKNKLAVTQPLTNLEGKPALMTCVYDLETDEKIETITPLIESTKPQDMGSCITYYRRYSLQALFALEAEDDDGKTASKPTKKAPSTAEALQADTPDFLD